MVGLSFGIKKIKIHFYSEVIIALITTLGTLGSMLLGNLFFYFVNNFNTNFLGGTILILLGLWTIIKYYVDHNQILKNPEKLDKDKSFSIDPKEAFVLAAALSVNNIGIGLGASIAGLNIYLTVFSTFCFSLLMLRSGYFLGTKFLSKTFEKKATIISGLLIIALGIYEIFI